MGGGGGGGGGGGRPLDFGSSVNPISTTGVHIVPNTLLRPLPPMIFKTFLRPWKEGMHLQQVAWPRQLQTF